MKLPTMLETAEARRGTNQTASANICGVTRATYRAWKRGQRPGLEHVPGIIRFTTADPVQVLRACGLDETGTSTVLGITLDEIRAHSSIRLSGDGGAAA